MSKLIALTFDDGPNTTITPHVLDILAEHQIVASFFLIADAITPESAAVARRAFDMGCEINNHSKTHSSMSKMTRQQIRDEINCCTEKIISLTQTPPRFFRPPYIDVSPTLFDEITEMTFICGSGCEDWVPEVTTAQRIERILTNARDGELLLLHDMPGNTQTVEALKVVIPALKQQGFRFVTCGQMFREKQIKPQRGWMYSNVYQTEPRNGI